MSAKQLQNGCAQTECEFSETPVGPIMVKDIVASKKVALSFHASVECGIRPGDNKSNFMGTKVH
jgi:hypothetical protein